MKTLTGLIRLFGRSGASDRAICDPYAHNGQLQLKASDLGHCAVYEKELERVCPITEENRKAKIAEFAEKQGFRLAYYKQGHCAIFLDDSVAHDIKPPHRTRRVEFGIKSRRIAGSSSQKRSQLFIRGPFAQIP